MIIRDIWLQEVLVGWANELQTAMVGVNSTFWTSGPQSMSYIHNYYLMTWTDNKVDFLASIGRDEARLDTLVVSK